MEAVFYWTHGVGAESKLIESEKRHIDNTLARVASKETEATHASVAALKSDKLVLTSELQTERKRVAEARADVESKERELHDLTKRVCALQL